MTFQFLVQESKRFLLKIDDRVALMSKIKIKFSVQWIISSETVATRVNEHKKY